jgi:xanthine dehydrogenase YagR molybdenum-binding subunit
MATVYPDGTALVRLGTTDIGVGTYTPMTQIAADALGLPIERVRFEPGDSVFPDAPCQGGAQITASVGNAVHEAALAVRGKILALAAHDEKSPLYGAKEQDITAQNNRRLRTLLVITCRRTLTSRSWTWFLLTSASIP